MLDTRTAPVARLVVLALVAAAPALARAQTATLTLTEPLPRIGTRPVLSLEDCRDGTVALEFNWEKQPLVQGEKEQVFLSKTDSCATEPSDPNAILVARQARPENGRGSFPDGDPPVTVQDLFEFATGKATCDEVGEIETTLFVCVRMDTTDTPGGSQTPTTASATIRLDTKAPDAPTEVKAAGRENALLVSWKAPEKGIEGFRVFIDGTERKVATGALREILIDKLENGKTYAVTVTARDDAGTTEDRANESEESTPVQGTPAEVVDFWETYREAGGDETGGCATGGAGLLALVGVLALVRRRRGLGALLVLLSIAAPARAQLDDAGTDEPVSFSQSPQHWTFEVRTGPWQPNIDDEPGLTVKPYETIFGGQQPLLWRAELARDVFELFGRLSLGVRTGFWQAEGHARTRAGEKAEDSVTLDVWPITPVLAYRADFLPRRFDIPLVPYAKVGFGFARWSTDVSDRTSSVGGDEGTGWGRGLEFGGGLQLVLDGAEPDKAAALDQDFGINSTSLVIDYTRVLWKGANGGMLLQGNQFSGGLLFAF